MSGHSDGDVGPQFTFTASLVAQTVVCLQHSRPRLELWVGKIPWRRKWKPTPVFLPGKFHGQKRLVGYIQSMGHQEWDVTEHLAPSPPLNASSDRGITTLHFIEVISML